MKIKFIVLGLISFITLFSSCVGEDVVFIDNTLQFERQLFSIAEDETISLNLVFRDENGEIISDQSSIDIEYSSDDSSILSIDEQGTITPLASNGTTTIRVNASSSDFTYIPIEDEITIGKVTISEAEELLIKANEDIDIDTILSEGYIPKITITSPVSEIAVDSPDLQLNAVYQNIKNQIEDVVFIWESNDTDLIEVNETGLITPLAKGSAEITATFNLNGNIISSEPFPIIVSEETITVTPVDSREIIGIGTLQSNSSYTVEGGFQIIRENGVTTLTLDATYSSGDEELPDLVVYLSNQTNTNNGASFISEDIGVQGEHSFIIPQSINPDDYQNVLLFCRMFGARVGFGIINR